MIREQPEPPRARMDVLRATRRGAAAPAPPRRLGGALLLSALVSGLAASGAGERGFARADTPGAEDQTDAALVRKRVLGSVVGIRVTLPEPRLRFRGRRKVVAEISPSHGTGSGIVVDPTGLILTCAHLLGEAPTVRVFLADDREVSGTVSVTDRTSDLALIKVQAGSLPSVDFSEKPDLRQGQPVHLASRPGGAALRYSEGILTMTGAYHLGHSPLEFFRQFSGEIEPGDSGGVLVDGAGRFIGVISVGLPQDKVGYALSREFVFVALARLLAGPPVIWPWLGAGVEAPSEGEGALIWTISPGSPAEGAGLRPGDLIVSIDDHPVEHFLPAMLVVVSRPVGSRFKLGIRRRASRAGAGDANGVAGGGSLPPAGERPEPHAGEAMESRLLLSVVRPLEPPLPVLPLFERLTGIRLGMAPASGGDPEGLAVLWAPAQGGEARRSYRIGSHLTGIVPGVGVVRALEEGRTDQELRVRTPEDLAVALRESVLSGNLTAALIWSTQGKREMTLLSGEARRYPLL